MEVIAINHQTTCVFIEVVDRCDNAVTECCWEVRCINNKIFVFTQKLYCRGIGESSGGEVALDFINAVHIYPLLHLCFTGYDFGIESLVDAVECDTPVCFHHKLLLQPQFALEILYLCMESYNLLADAFHGTHFGKIRLGTAFIVGIEVVEVHNFVFDKEIKLAI